MNNYTKQLQQELLDSKCLPMFEIAVHTSSDYSAFKMRFKDHDGNILGVKSFNELGDVLQAHVIKQVTTGGKK